MKKLSISPGKTEEESPFAVIKSQYVLIPSIMLSKLDSDLVDKEKEQNKSIDISIARNPNDKIVSSSLRWDFVQTFEARTREVVPELFASTAFSQKQTVQSSEEQSSLNKNTKWATEDEKL